MSGHSKWSQIKRQKGVADIKKGQVFTKLARAITVAVKSGGSADPNSNFKLRLAIEQARAVNMPKDSIERAVEHGLSKAGDLDFEELVYEGYGPGGIAVLVEATTENRNRTASAIKNIFEKSGGNLASPGAVMWQFSKEGLILVELDGKTAEEIILGAADLGAEDAIEVEDGVEIYTKPEELEDIKRKLFDRGFKVEIAEISARPQNTVVINDSEVAKKVLDFVDRLDSDEDVQKVYANFDISKEILGQLK